MCTTTMKMKMRKTTTTTTMTTSKVQHAESTVHTHTFLPTLIDAAPGRYVFKIDVPEIYLTYLQRRKYDIICISGNRNY